MNGENQNMDRKSLRVVADRTADWEGEKRWRRYWTGGMSIEKTS